MPHPMTRRSLLAKAAAALAALPVGAFAARGAEASVAVSRAANEAVFTPKSMQVSFDDLPYLMSSVMGPPKVETDGVSMTYQFGSWESVAPSGPRFGALRYFDGDGGIAGWRVFDYQEAEVIRDYPCDACVESSVEDGGFWAERLATTITSHLNVGLLGVEDVKPWPPIAKPFVGALNWHGVVVD